MSTVLVHTQSSCSPVFDLHGSHSTPQLPLQSAAVFESCSGNSTSEPTLGAQIDLFLDVVSQTNMEDLSKKSGKLYLVDLAGTIPHVACVLVNHTFAGRF